MHYEYRLVNAADRTYGWFRVTADGASRRVQKYDPTAKVVVRFAEGDEVYLGYRADPDGFRRFEDDDRFPGYTLATKLALLEPSVRDRDVVAIGYEEEPLEEVFALRYLYGGETYGAWNAYANRMFRGLVEEDLRAVGLRKLPYGFHVSNFVYAGFGSTLLPKLGRELDPLSAPSHVASRYILGAYGAVPRSLKATDDPRFAVEIRRGAGEWIRVTANTEFDRR